MPDTKNQNEIFPIMIRTGMFILHSPSFNKSTSPSQKRSRQVTQTFPTSSFYKILLLLRLKDAKTQVVKKLGSAEADSGVVSGHGLITELCPLPTFASVSCE